MQGKTPKVSGKYILSALVLFIALAALKSCDSASETTSASEVTIGQASLNERMPEMVDFNLHIRPILSDRCFACHGPDANKRESGYRLDLQEDAYKALKDKPNVFGIVPGHSDQSAVVDRIGSTDPNLVMPPPASNLTLSEHEKALIIKWIDQGAEWKKHWSFIPLAETEVPTLKDWGNNDIDAFVVQKLNDKGLTPGEQATRSRLLRRMSFDLTGLPPAEDLRKRFMADESMDYENLVDELMNSPAYGEHMATTWLDLARYSDSHGYQDDLERIMWPWRDWVISAFNRKMPYDQFVTWQLAGDLTPNASKEQILATGFNRNHKITQEGGVIDEEYRVEYVTDRANTFGKAFLGLTLECAKCHDHKYDPLSQKEYFSIYSFFNSVPEKGRIEYNEIPQPNIEISEKDLKGILSFVNAKDFKGEQLKVMVMADSAASRPTYVLNRGQYDLHGEAVSPTTPSSIKVFEDSYSKDRLGLSKWLFAEDNPLTARVTVNRVWQSFFGRGLVKTPDDFGNQGSLPSHPALLDYLAYEFIQSGWDMQDLQKKVLLSAAYQQSSKVTPELIELDPENTWLTRGPRYRMSFEMIRDNALAVSGLLNAQVGGPSVKPYQPDGLWAETTSGIGLTKYIPDTDQALYRRSLYTFWKRTVPPPTMMTFDGASRDFCEVQRQKTNTPLQALVMMNDPQMLEAARVLAYEIVGAEDNENERLQQLFVKILGRTPSEEEKGIITDFYQLELERFQNDEVATKDYLSIGSYPQKVVSAEAAAYMSVISTVFNLDEAISKT